MSAGGALAQPCFTADQCAQVRINNERMAADRQAAQAAAEVARVRQERAAAKEEARERARQALERHQAELEQERAQALRQADFLQAQADARQRAQDEALRDAQQRVELERLQAQQRAEQAAAQAAAEQRARDAAALRARQQAEQQAAYEEQRRQRLVEAENRAAAQLAAESSPDNHCHDRKTAGDLIDYFNGLSSAADMNNRAIDIDHLTTIRFDAPNQAISCHGAFVLQNGTSIVGTMTTRLNVAGRLLTEFHRD